MYMCVCVSPDPAKAGPTLEGGGGVVAYVCVRIFVCVCVCEYV